MQLWKSFSQTFPHCVLCSSSPSHGPLQERGGKAYHPFSPSIDRKDNDKGYVKGNVWIVSHKANTMKSYGNAEELAKIARNLSEMKETA